MVYTNHKIRVTTLIDYTRENMTVRQVLAIVDSYRQEPRWRNAEIYLDSERKAIVAREAA